MNLRPKVDPIRLTPPPPPGPSPVSPPPPIRHEVTVRFAGDDTAAIEALTRRLLEVTRERDEARAAVVKFGQAAEREISKTLLDKAGVEGERDAADDACRAICGLLGVDYEVSGWLNAVRLKITSLGESSGGHRCHDACPCEGNPVYRKHLEHRRVDFDCPFCPSCEDVGVPSGGDPGATA